MATKRPFTLLEVLIAFGLIALTAIPLLSLHAFALKEQRIRQEQWAAGRLANRLYGEIVLALYQNQIPWEVIEKGDPIPIEQTKIAPLPFQASYRFVQERAKVEKEGGRGYFLVHLILTLNQAERKLTYDYLLFITRNGAASETT